MNTIILNGSPKGNSNNCNSRFFTEEFVRYMKNPCEIKCIANTDNEELARYAEGFDTIIIILPLYIHAMPGIVMKFIETLEAATTKDKYIGFIVQAGFMETAQGRFVEAYFTDLARQLNRNYLGTVLKGEAAGIYMFPKMFKKIFKLLNDLGKAYEETHTFDKGIVKKLGKPYEISKFNLHMLNIINKVGLSNVMWNSALKKNNAMDKRLDRPFL